MTHLELMDRIDAFKGFTDDQLNALKNICTETSFNIGDKLFTEGDDALHLWFIIEGQVDLRFEMPDGRPSSNELTVSSMEVKNIDSKAKTLGWSCFVPPFKMRLSAYCVSRKCKIIKLEKEKLLQMFEKDQSIGYKFMSYIITVVGYRFHQFQDEVAKQKGKNLMSG